MQPDTTPTIRHAMGVLFASGQVVELRILDVPRVGTVSGFFDDPDKLAAAAASLDGKAGLYVTVNEVNPALLARAANRLQERPKATTADADIIRRRWLPLDFDPVRPSGISTTDGEHEAALRRARAVRSWLAGMDWPEPVLADSGNGAHLLYRVDLPNDEASRELVQRCLEAAALYHGDKTVGVDLATSNAARIWKLYGTFAHKGDSLPDRPHRRSAILEVPDPVRVVPREALEELAGLVPRVPTPEPSRNGHGGTFDLERWIAEHNLPVMSAGPWQAGRKWILNPCPWDPAHNNQAAYIVQHANGAIAAGCHHHSCHGKGWPELRALREPDYRRNGHDKPGDGAASNLQPHLPPIGTPVVSEVRREVSAAELKARPHQEIDYLPFLGQPGYIARGWTTLVAAYPKCGKTELLARLCGEWTEETILYVTEEPESIWAARLDGLPGDWQHMRLLLGLGMDPQDILNRIASGAEKVIIVDTVRNLLGLQDETDNSEVARVIGPYVAAARKGSKTLILSHHVRKGGGEHGEGITGGHAFLGIVDVALEILREANLGERRRRVRGWGRLFPIEEAVYCLEEDGSMSLLGSPKAVEIGAVKERVVSVLNGDWRTRKELLEDLDEPRPALEQLRLALGDLVREGAAERDPSEDRRGATYRYRLAGADPQPNLPRVGSMVVSEVGEARADTPGPQPNLPRTSPMVVGEVDGGGCGGGLELYPGDVPEGEELN